MRDSNTFLLSPPTNSRGGAILYGTDCFVEQSGWFRRTCCFLLFLLLCCARYSVRGVFLLPFPHLPRNHVNLHMRMALTIALLRKYCSAPDFHRVNKSSSNVSASKWQKRFSIDEKGKRLLRSHALSRCSGGSRQHKRLTTKGGACRSNLVL